MNRIAKELEKLGFKYSYSKKGCLIVKIEGENIIIHTLDDKEYEGTLLPIKASVHLYGDIPREMPRIAENMEVRLDEEVGHGVSEIPKDGDEFVVLDIGLVTDDAHGDEKKVSIAARDNKTVYDLKIRKKLQEAADKNGIHYTVGVYNRYGSDATASILQGTDLRYACIGPNVDATHHYERTHVDGIVETIKLLIAYF